MRYFVIVLLLIGTIIVAGISTPVIDAVPPLDSQFIYDASEVILVGKVTSVNSTFSPTHNLYQIEVEKYLKNQLDTDTVLAAGQNTVITKLGSQVFTSGDRALFFLNNDTIGYDKYTGVFGVSYESKIIEPQWDHCKIFEKSIPAAHWVFGGIGPMPKISQQNNTDTENFLVGKKALITYDMFNHTPAEKNIDVGIQIKNLDDPNSLYIYTEISQHLLKACTTYETLSWDFTPTKPGRYSIEFYDLKGSQMTIGFTAREQGISKHLDRLSYPVPWERESPLKQFEAGIPIDKIQCKEGLELILRTSDGSPACVKPETKQKLIERDWAAEDNKISETKSSWNSTYDWNSLKLVQNNDGLYCSSVNNKMTDDCYSLEEIVFGNHHKKGKQGWKIYPGGAGWRLPENSTLTPIYKEVKFGMMPLDFDAMLNDKIFVDKCYSHGGTWNAEYTDCEEIWEICRAIGGIRINQDVTPPCTVDVCLDVKLIRNSCVFPYEN